MNNIERVIYNVIIYLNAKQITISVKNYTIVYLTPTVYQANISINRIYNVYQFLHVPMDITLTLNYNNVQSFLNVLRTNIFQLQDINVYKYPFAQMADISLDSNLNVFHILHVKMVITLTKLILSAYLYHHVNSSITLINNKENVSLIQNVQQINIFP